MITKINMKNFNRKSSLIFLPFLILISFNNSYSQLKEGVTSSYKNFDDTHIRLLTIQVIKDNIIRVITSPTDSISKRPSLMILDKKREKPDYSEKNEGDWKIIQTSRLKVKINTKTAAVEFYDVSGKALLKEKVTSGKIITSANVMGEETFHVQQIFESADEEGFYGLGTHQNGIFNYKGHDVDLYQMNIIHAVPFLVSSKNYGILWDNNSRTKFGDIRDYQSISGLNIYNKEGKPGGFTVEYFKDNKFTDLYTERTEPRIEHEFLDVSDPFPEGFRKNVKAVRYIGEIESNEDGIHKLRLYSSFFTKMWIDDELVVDSWRQNWLPWTHYPKLNMKKGERHKIKIEWIHGGGYIGLKYLPPQDTVYDNHISLWSEVADQIDYYFIYGDDLDEVISGNRELTGKAPMMPKWAMGFWQCRERYKTQEQLLDVVKEFRNRKIPIDNIVQDWFYWEEDKWGDHEFDKSRFPDPEGMVKELHENLNTKIMISVWPKFYVGTKNYEIFEENGWLYRRNVEKKEKDWVGPGYLSTFYDAYNVDANKLFWKGINEKLFRKGFDAWWLDATEPDIHSNLSRLETRLRIGPTALGTSARYLNSFSLVNARGVYEGQRKANPDKRVFILTRSSFPGQQRYAAAAWSGDIATRWFDLKTQIAAGLNFSLSALPYWTTDIGGFAVEPRFEHPKNDEDIEEWRELNTRWFQFGTFCPLFRVHGQYPYREMFNLAPDDHAAYKTMLKYDKLRYRLMPYIYSLTGMVTRENYTIMRALVMDFGKDKKVKNIGDQFMFGPSLLINPVTDYKTYSRNVYLPETAGWYNLNTGRFYNGGQRIQADAPYSDIPIFVKAGSILPVGPEIQYTSEKPVDPLRLYVYTGADGTFKLYEDENVNYNYENGLFSLIPISYSEGDRKLVIGKRQGSFPGMLASRTFEIIWYSKLNSGGMDFTQTADEVVKYNGQELTIKHP